MFLSLVVCLWHYFLLASSFLLSFSWPSVLCRCEICNSVGSSKWLMVHPPVILRQAGEYVHFAWFPSSIFQTSPELGGDTAWNGFQEKQQHKWKSRPRWYNHFVQHEHFCKHVWRGGGGGGGVGGGVGSRLSALQGRRQGFCVRWDGVNRQIGSLLYVSSLRFHAGWIYRESQCTGMCRGLLGGRYHRGRARSCELHMMDWWWKEVNIFYCLLK